MSYNFAVVRINGKSANELRPSTVLMSGGKSIAGGTYKLQIFQV
jgi:hypothetical protein